MDKRAPVLLLNPVVWNFSLLLLWSWHLSLCKKAVSSVRQPLLSTTYKWIHSTNLAAKVSLIPLFFLAKHSWLLTLTFFWSVAGSFYSFGKACIKSKNGHSDRRSKRLNISANVHCWCYILTYSVWRHFLMHNLSRLQSELACPMINGIISERLFKPD